jgi:hypothetical protein
MITDDLFIYLMFQMIILAINLVGYFKIPYLGFIGIIATISVAYPTIVSFGDYYMMGVILILMNGTLPIMGFTKAYRGK